MHRLAPLVLLVLACEELPRTYSSAGPAQLLFADRFDGAELGPSWKSTGPGARLEGGELVVLKASRGVALERILPALTTAAEK